MATCGTCSRTFVSAQARYQHMMAVGHTALEFKCDGCSKYFASRGAVVNHMNAKKHWTYFECTLCDKTFQTEEQAKDHEIEEHYFCAECDRQFGDYNAIRMHFNSRVHRGLNIQCPFCNKLYATATGLSHHLEGGNCPSLPFVSRDDIYKFVRMKDPTNLISKNLLGWKGSPQYEATAEAWNGSAYECYFCHGQFKKLGSLNQHLSSPTHQQNLYHCPKRAGCGREFSSLAALMNHLESESCGYTKFENVQRSVKDIVSSDRHITFN
ncbi:hypothetical protein F5Y06DRAFT_304991 [Hypoxylon sp. FL0890]|nr:hypothetical protein F5Y06DRAFT_304991 [Hypoxylon sp. FL0890]